MIEHRRFSRLSLALTVEFLLDGRPDRYVGRAQDISLGGMAIVTDCALPFHASVVVSAHLSEGKSPFLLAGIVRWFRGGIVGIQFGPLGANETHALVELLRKNEDNELGGRRTTEIGRVT